MKCQTNVKQTPKKRKTNVKETPKAVATKVVPERCSKGQLPYKNLIIFKNTCSAEHLRVIASFSNQWNTSHDVNVSTL